MFICKTTDCKMALSGAQFPMEMECPVCGVNLVPANEIKYDDEENKIITKYPYLIAYPFKEMLEEKHPNVKISLLKDVSQNILKYIGLIVTTEYFQSDKQSMEVTHFFENKLFTPAMGNWNSLSRVMIEYLESEKHLFFMPELVAFYNRVEKKGKQFTLKTQITDESDNTEKKSKTETLIGALVYFRNTYLGHSVTLSDEKSHEVFNEYYPFLKTLLLEMDFCINYPMIKYEDGYIFSLMGNTIEKIGKHSSDIIEDERVWFQNYRGDRMFLVPFFIVPKEYIIETSDNTGLFIYDQFSSKRMVFFSPERKRGESKGKVAKKLMFLINEKSKQIPFSLETLTEEELKEQISYVNKSVTDSLFTEQKVIKNTYQKRVDAEISLKSWVKAKASIYFLASEAGGGKTNLLHEMTKQYLETGFDTLLLRANRFSFSSFNEQLKHELNLANDFVFSQFEFFQRKQDNPFLILIDGVNECVNPIQFLNSIKEFLYGLKEGGIKIVITWREDTKKNLPELDESWDALLYDADKINNNEEEKLLVHKAFWLKRLNKIELEGAWNNYTLQKQYKTKFTLEELTYKDRSLSEQLSNPLLLRMFLELFHRKTLKALPEGAINIWQLWYKNISKTKGTTEVLLAFASFMIENQKSILPLDMLYDHPVLSVYVRDIQINNPFQKLIEKGILSQYFLDHELVVSFTMEALFHYCLSKYLESETEYNNVDKLLELIETNKLSGIKEAIKHILWNDVKKKNYSRLNYFITLGKNYSDVTSFPLAQAFILLQQHY